MKKRKGVALFQLLALIAFLAMLIGLLLPAIQRVREAAARMESLNNMKMLGLALHNHADALKNLPSGVDGNGFSAHVHLLPYIEQEPLWKNIDRTKKVDDNAAARATVIKLFISPRDPMPQANKDTAPNSYLFAAGTQASLKDNDGVFYHDSSTRFVAITDGLSNTVFLVEALRGDGGKKAVTVRRQHVRLAAKALKGIKADAGVKIWKGEEPGIVGDRGSSWMDGRFLQGTFTATLPINSDKPDVDCGGEGGLFAPRTIDGTILAGMGDGSVRAVSAGVKFETWKAANTRAGNEALGDDW